jgi:hypothetical protein
MKNTWLPLSNFSSFLRPEKAIPAVSLNSTLQGNWLHVFRCSTFWQHENVILQGVIRTSDQVYLAFIEIQFSILAT